MVCWGYGTGEHISHFCHDTCQGFQGVRETTGYGILVAAPGTHTRWEIFRVRVPEMAWVPLSALVARGTLTPNRPVHPKRGSNAKESASAIAHLCRHLWAENSPTHFSSENSTIDSQLGALLADHRRRVHLQYKIMERRRKNYQNGNIAISHDIGHC